MQFLTNKYFSPLIRILFLFQIRNKKMDLSIVNNDYYLSGMAALIGDIDSKK